MQKGTDKCNEEELKILHESPEMVTEIERRAARQANVKERKKEVCFIAWRLSAYLLRQNTRTVL